MGMGRMPRTIFITGASSGIGEALASLYAEPGRTLGLLARREAALRAVAVRHRGERRTSKKSTERNINFRSCRFVCIPYRFPPVFGCFWRFGSV